MNTFLQKLDQMRLKTYERELHDATRATLEEVLKRGFIVADVRVHEQRVAPVYNLAPVLFEFAPKAYEAGSKVVLVSEDLTITIESKGR